MSRGDGGCDYRYRGISHGSHILRHHVACRLLSLYCSATNCASRPRAASATRCPTARDLQRRDAARSPVSFCRVRAVPTENVARNQDPKVHVHRCLLSPVTGCNQHNNAALRILRALSFPVVSMSMYPPITDKKTEYFTSKFFCADSWPNPLFALCSRTGRNRSR